MSVPVKITREMLSAMQGVIPALLATCAKDGTPNVTYISQVFYVNNDHVALSWQFMNKTARNLLENPVATIIITDPQTASMWKLGLRYLERQTEGPLFDQMDMQLLAITSMMRAPVGFSLKAAVVCRVETLEQIHDGTPGV